MDEWIKVRTSLPRHPKLARIAELCNIKRSTALGALIELLCLADEQTCDGIFEELSPTSLRRIIAIRGYVEALVEVGWLKFEERNGKPIAVIARFNEHNGSTAKRRAAESRRKMSARNADKNRTSSGHFAHLEEEVEEEKNKSSASDAAAPVEIGEPTKTANAAEKLRNRLKRKESQSWLAPYDLAYADRQKVPLPVSVSLRPIAEVRKIHGNELTIAVWRYYCATEKGEFLTAAGFRRAFGTWLERYHASNNESAPEALLCVFRAYPQHRRGARGDAIAAMRSAGVTVESAPNVVQAIESWCKSEQWRKDSGKWIPGFGKFLTERMHENPPIDANAELGAPGRDTGEYWHHGVRVCPKCDTIHHLRLQPCGMKPEPKAPDPDFAAKKAALLAKLLANIEARAKAEGDEREARFLASFEPDQLH